MEQEKYKYTERLDDAMESVEQAFGIPYCDADFYQALDVLRDSDTSNWSANLDALLAMIEACGYKNKIPRGKKFDFYLKQVQELIAEGNILNSQQLSEKVRGMCKLLYEHYKKFPTPAAYMERLVDQLCNPEDPWQNDTLRLRILKQFIKYGGCLTSVKGCNRAAICTYVAQQKGVESISGKELLAALNDGSLTDDIFSLLHTASSDEIKERYRLLVMADRLASGAFVRSGGTKQDLYLFAICYNMIFAAHPAPKVVIDEKRDIEQQLFTDYYAANVFVYLSAHYLIARNNRARSFMADPTGTTINFKNPAELVHLYYIRKPSKPFAEDETSSVPGAMSSLEKLNAIATMLHEIQAAGENNINDHAADKQPGATIALKNRFKAGSPEDPFSLSEEAFKKFLLDNFDCRRGSSSPFSVNASANTATEKYKEIVQRLHARGSEVCGDLKGVPELEDAVYRYGLFFDEEFTQSIGSHPDQADFLTILHQVNHILKDEELIKKCKPDAVNSASITRTKLLAVLYYDFNNRHSGTARRNGSSFNKHYQQFCHEINPVLADCNFTPINSKSLLDMLLVFSSYVCINA